MKVIDLLNKIANGEEVPTKIKIHKDGTVYTWNSIYYINENSYTIGDCWQLDKILNTDIEIIEEPKKIEKLDTFKTTNFGAEYVRENRNKINELVEKVILLEEAVNELKGKGE